GPGNWSWEVRVADFSGDGRADVAGRNLTTGEWWVGVSTGTAFTFSVWMVWDPSITWSTVTVADFNGDGVLDLMGRAPNGDWWVGTSTGSAFNVSFWGPSSFTPVAVGDFNGDGRAELAFLDTTTGALWVSESTGWTFS